MSTRDEAARVLAEHEAVYRSVPGTDDSWFDCDCGTTYVWCPDAEDSDPRAAFAAHMADALAAAGLLRPDPTGEDREVMLGIIKHHVNPAIGSLRRLDRDGVNTTPGINGLIAAFNDATDAVLAAGFRRGPETVQPADAASGWAGAGVEMELVGTDGLTDAERAEYARRYAEGPARVPSPEEFAAVRDRLRGESRD